MHLFERADWHKNQNISVDWLKISKSVVAICNETKITHTEANILAIVQSNSDILPITVDY